MSRLDPPPINRRSFLSLASLGSFLAALGTATAGMLRLPNPAVLPGPVPVSNSAPLSSLRLEVRRRSPSRISCSSATTRAFMRYRVPAPI